MTAPHAGTPSVPTASRPAQPSGRLFQPRLPAHRTAETLSTVKTTPETTPNRIPVKIICDNYSRIHEGIPVTQNSLRSKCYDPHRRLSALGCSQPQPNATIAPIHRRHRHRHRRTAGATPHPTSGGRPAPAPRNNSRLFISQTAARTSRSRRSNPNRRLSSSARNTAAPASPTLPKPCRLRITNRRDNVQPETRRQTPAPLRSVISAGRRPYAAPPA